MRVNSYIFMAILASALVTWIPRILPFLLVKYKGLPAPVTRFLKYLPISIIFALVLSSLVDGKIGSLPQFHWLDLVVTIPSLFVAFRYKKVTIITKKLDFCNNWSIMGVRKIKR